MKNIYKYTCNYKGKSKTYSLLATNLNDAYEEAGRLIIDNYEDIDDDSCDILDSANRKNWKTDVMPFLMANENMLLSNIEIVNNEE